MLSWATVRLERIPEILTQAPGPIAFYAALLKLQPERHARTLELLACAQQFATFAVMRFKHALACPRPADYSALVQPLIATPGHSSFPSGHSTQSYCLSRVLRSLRDVNTGSPLATLLERQAHRIAENRVVAGLHFPIDSAVGSVLGDALGGYFINRCGGKGGWLSRSFNAGAYDGSQDFAGLPSAARVGAGQAWSAAREARSLAPIRSLQWLWQRARAEWAPA